MTPNPRWVLARKLAALVVARWTDSVYAVGVHGSLAHGDDTDGSDIDLVVVTNRPEAGPEPSCRRVDGIIVDLGVITSEEYLGEARTLRVSWPLDADQFLTTAALHDPHGWHEQLRLAHEARLADATDDEFLALARTSLGPAVAAMGKAERLLRAGEKAMASVAAADAAVATALTEGLCARRYFRSRFDALTRTGLLGASLSDVRQRQEAQLRRVAAGGMPIDASLEDLVSAR